jgi:Thiol:disulfide interchange protein DsbD, N-terminal
MHDRLPPVRVMTFLNRFGLVVVCALVADVGAVGYGRQAGASAPLDSSRESRMVRSAYADIELFPIQEAAGGLLTLKLTVHPDPELHVYASSESGFLGPKLTFSRESGIEIVKVDQPEPEVLAPPSESAGARVYSRAFTLRYDVRSRAAPRSGRIEGTLRYQACTDRICYKPETIRLDWIWPRGDARAPRR